MNCPLQNDNAEVLLDYCARKLSPEALAIFERHLTSCSECRQFAEGQKALWEALDSWDAPAVSADFDRQLYGRIAAHDGSSWWQRTWVRLTRPASNFAWPKAVPVTAACATLVAAFLIYSPAPHPAESPSKVEAVDLDQVQKALDDLEMLKLLQTPKESQNL